MRHRILGLRVLALAAGIALSFGQVTAAQVGGARLVGAWHVQVTQVDCQSGAVLGPSFPSLLTFAVGRTLAEDTTNPVFGPGQRGGGEGVWHFRGGSAYGAKSTAFIKYTTQPDPQTHNPGFEAGQQTITQDITFDSITDQWTSKATIAFADTTGTVYRQGCAVATAQRF